MAGGLTDDFKAWEHDTGQEQSDPVSSTPRPRLRTSTRGAVNIDGASVGGKFTEVTLSTSTWKALPAVSLVGRRYLAIQNKSGLEIKVNWDNTETDYKGMVIDTGAERFYDVAAGVVLYAKSASGTPTINIEELA